MISGPQPRAQARGVSAPPDSQRRLAALVLILVLGCLIFVRVLPLDPSLHEFLTRPLRPDPADAERARLAAHRANDPALGTILPVPPTEGRNEPHWILVVIMGYCSDCVARDLLLADRIGTQNPQIHVVALSPTLQTDLEQFRLKRGLRMLLLSDPEGEFARRYNAAWLPRAYLLSRHGSLLWCQQTTKFQPSEVESAFRGSNSGGVQ